MSIHNIRLPNFLEKFAIGFVSFSTSIVSCGSGREVRNSDSETVARWDRSDIIFLTRKENYI